MAEKHFIFICGLHKSGTSLLHQILRSHPDISGFAHTGVPEDEGQHLQTVYPPAKAFGGPGSFGFNKESFMDERHRLATSENSARLLKEWNRYWDQGKDYLLEKSPPNIVRTRFLQKLFPNSSFVVILRHPIAIAYATKKWNNASSILLIEHALRCYERCWSDRLFLNRVYVLHYEEFVTDPIGHMRALSEWIGLRSFKFEQEVRSNDNKKYFAMWKRERRNVMKVLVGKFTGLASKLDEFEKRSDIFGYSIYAPDKIKSLDLADSDACIRP